MDSGTEMFTPPDGPPRFVAAFYEVRHGWRIAAEAPARGPVDYAAAEMIRTVQSRGQAPQAEIWGPAREGDGWQRLDSLAPGKGAFAARPSVAAQPSRSARAERLLDRRHQVLTSALARAGLNISQPVDDDAVGRLSEALDEETLRRVALWLSRANVGG
ncbi:hypothetical protein [Streptomyces sp. NPDC059611]|uniref:hypothetical protein n=1 Tax=Streptomyces sp. NPDC059611 TaxID=3346884 RepID=UPI0036B6EF65